jgi:hypothetical protein
MQKTKSDSPNKNLLSRLQIVIFVPAKTQNKTFILKNESFILTNKDFTLKNEGFVSSFPCHKRKFALQGKQLSTTGKATK